MNPDKFRGKQHPSKNSTDLFVKMIKENKDFEDLCDERNKIVRIIEQHQIVVDALFTELKKWDIRVEKMFQEKISKTDLKKKNPTSRRSK